MKTVLLVIDSPKFERIRPQLAELAPVVLCDDKSETAMIRERFSMAALDASGDGPKWSLIIPMGSFHGATLAPVGGSFNFTAEFFASMVENWKANGAFRIPVRWGHEHQQNDDPAKAKELDRKAGNITDLRVTAAGLEGLTSWNAAGRKDVEGGEFDGWSAEFSMRHLNRLTGEVGGPLLSGVALTNRPFFNTMPPVAASTTSTEPTPQHRSNTMNEEQLKALRAKLGLAADATPEQCIAAASKVSATAPVVPADIIAAAVKPSQDQVIALTAKVKDLEDKGLERDVDAAIEQGKRGDGKLGRTINDDMRGFIMATAKGPGGLEGAKKLIAAIPASVPLTAIGNDTKGDDTKVSAAAAQKELDALVAAKMKANEGMSFKDAHRAVGREHKELADRAFTVPTTHAATAEN